MPHVFWDPYAPPDPPQRWDEEKPKEERREGSEKEKRRDGRRRRTEREIGTERDREGKAVVPVLPPPRANR